VPRERDLCGGRGRRVAGVRLSSRSLPPPDAKQMTMQTKCR
jgi:hypothetical protein